MDIELIGEVPPALEREFRYGTQARAAIAAVKQEQLNAAAAQPARMIEGIGQLTERIDGDVYWLMRARFGGDCWNDADFRRRARKSGLIQAIPGQSDRVIVPMSR